MLSVKSISPVCPIILPGVPTPAPGATGTLVALGLTLGRDNVLDPVLKRTLPGTLVGVVARDGTPAGVGAGAPLGLRGICGVFGVFGRIPGPRPPGL